MKVNILAFGIARDILGASSLSVDLPGQPTVQRLKDQLCREYPAFEKLSSLAVAVNMEYAEEHHLISPEDEVVIIPPVSGG